MADMVMGGLLRAWEESLGDPLDATNPSGFAHATAADHRREFNSGLKHALLKVGIGEWLAPPLLGGRVAAMSQLLALTRLIAQRDPTVAISFGASALASMPVWLEGSSWQRERIGDLLIAGVPVAYALSEENHGADISATEVTATPRNDGWTIDGTKWPINNAHASTAVVTARTGVGVRGLSIFLVDQGSPGATCWGVSDRLDTHGLRGGHLAGLHLRECPVGPEALVGRHGGGLELNLKALQLSRSLVSGLALGAFDTCYAATLAFARNRVLYGAPVVALQPVRRRLLDARLDGLIAQSVAQTVCRVAHVYPDQLAIASACAKYVVPAICNEAIESLGVILGARSYLAGEHWDGVFEKFSRDAAVTPLFDGASPVTLQAVLGQLPELASSRHNGLVSSPDPLLHSAKFPAPWEEPGRLDVGSAEDTVAQALEVIGPRLLEDFVDTPHVDELRRVLARLCASLRGLDAEVEERVTDPAWRNSGAAFDLAVRYTYLYAAGACIVECEVQRSRVGEHEEFDGALLASCLRRVDERLGGRREDWDLLDEHMSRSIGAAWTDRWTTAHVAQAQSHR